MWLATGSADLPASGSPTTGERARCVADIVADNVTLLSLFRSEFPPSLPFFAAPELRVYVRSAL